MPIKAKRDHSYPKELVQAAIDCAAFKTALPIPVIPSLPENVAYVQKPNKEETVKRLRPPTLLKKRL